MQKKIFLFAFLYFFINPISLFAQIVEGTACTAICMDATKSSITGRMPAANGISPNQNLPCGPGNSEDNPAWWILRPSGNSLSFQVAATNCVGGGLQVQMTIWEGDFCGDITALNCIVGTSGVLTVPTTPCKVYYLQVDGFAESQCNIVLTYDKNQILTKVDKPKITGPEQICKGADATFCASIPTMNGCRPDSWKWTLEPASAGTISGAFGSDCATLKLNGVIPLNGKVKVCVEPVFKGKCPPTTQKECFEVEVLELKPATCDLTICPELRPVVYELIKCIKTTNPTLNAPFTPETFVIGNNFLPGTTTTKKIDYTITGSGCKGEVNLKIKVLENKEIILPAVTICPGETKIIKGEQFTCANTGTIPKIIKKETSQADKELGFCDTTFRVLITCSPYAGTMQNKFILMANNVNKSISVKNKITATVLGAGDTYTYVLHEGNTDKIVNQLATSQTGVFKFDATKMKCNKVYYVSYAVGPILNGAPNLADKCASITPKGQPIVWLCPIKAPTAAAAREDNQDISLTENAPLEAVIYPNPTDDKFFVALPEVKNATLNLFDLQGKLVLSQNEMTQYDASHYEVQVSDLPKGIYLLKMNLDGKSTVQKIIVE